MVGRTASSDSSILLASSCDGDIMGVITIMPASDYGRPTKLPMYWNLPRPRNLAEYAANLRKGYQYVGDLTLARTYRTIILGGNVESMTTGGLNEHGLSIAIEFIPMRPGLACQRGVVGPNSNHWTTSLIANGLMRARSAREAIRLIGAMVEHYGFQYYRAPMAGVALPIADSREAWLMEIFGPGSDWTPQSGKPGGVWAAQRIPDGEVGCSANRSRIGKMDLADVDHFLASPNVFTLAQELGFWRKGEPFVWHEVYGMPGGRENCLREWRALSLAAPSLHLKATGDPRLDRYPFSIKPDAPLGVKRLLEIMRDGYQGTEYDITSHAAFNPSGKKSPLARPWGPSELFDLLRIRPERAIGTPSSGYVLIAQLRERFPPPVGNCLWFAYGPANTSCFAPVYAGVTDLPDVWAQPANFARIDRAQPQWNFRLVNSLANNLRYQDAVRDIEQVIRPAEERFLRAQARFEKLAASAFHTQGVAASEKLVTAYSTHCLKQVGAAYHDLVDYLMYRYLFGNSEISPPPLPVIAAPLISEEMKP
jgi:dipeptidase